jgi:hypothetical protein
MALEAQHTCSCWQGIITPACFMLSSVPPQRLKEQGWNVDRTERKMLMCGVAGLPAGGAAAAGADGLQDLLAGAWPVVLALLLPKAWRWVPQSGALAGMLWTLQCHMPPKTVFFNTFTLVESL